MGVDGVQIEGENKALVGNVKLAAGDNVQMEYDFENNAISISSTPISAEMAVTMVIKDGEKYDKCQKIDNPEINITTFPAGRCP